jgi:hypothetical protein
MVDQLISRVKVMPILTADLSPHIVPIELDALWDTGAMVTCVTPAVRNRLKLSPSALDESTILSGLTGNAPAERTFISIQLANSLEIEYCPVYVVDFEDDDFEMIIGMDIITMGDFAVCNTGGETSFSFVIPSFPDRINFTEKADQVNKRDIR